MTEILALCHPVQGVHGVHPIFQNFRQRINNSLSRRSTSIYLYPRIFLYITLLTLLRENIYSKKGRISAGKWHSTAVQGNSAHQPVLPGTHSTLVASMEYSALASFYVVDDRKHLLGLLNN